ncbi:unnamed protein product [Didymodactylos carnosus]|uniref:MACPF domain-containing protein n=1 Tax=Didymodactylos carnosus TaxID=1234261 RepID=A0A814P559_9BILA|nr:unnamed protein product [Didymodactylos carnosus]CAF1103038.1 unnamed protein product [Didymodactylos carnosus]CAF3506957.1 unnamed protein product [Didymodactylos carnosus]CAF3867816.1 unnamed protein product [Didymodactylos carnosus]
MKEERTVKKSTDKSVKEIYGLDIVGCGYDIASLTSKQCLVDTSEVNDTGSWADPLNNSLLFTVPYGFHAFNAPEALSVDEIVMITTIDDYWKKTHYVNEEDDDGFLGFGAKYEKTEIDTVYNRFFKHTYYLASTIRQIIWYTLTVATFPPPKLNPYAEKLFKSLPANFNISDLNNTRFFRQFFDAFGTHIVTSSAMGGLVWALDWYESCLLKIKSTTWIKHQVKRRHDPLGIFRSSSESEETTISLEETFTNYSTYSLQLIGGTETIPIDQWKQWIPTIKEKPRPVTYRLRPIYTLLPVGSPEREKLKQATFSLRTEMKNNASQYITQLQLVPPQPASMCNPPPTPPPTVLFEKRSLSSAFQLGSEEVDEFCPYVSYNGVVCHGKTKKKLLLPSARMVDNGPTKLPRGVGMSFDIITGEVMFPALQLTYNSSSTWVDPSTKKSFILFNEAILKSAPTKSVFEHMFKNEEDMFQFWQPKYVSGPLYGGEFGRVKKFMPYYNKYFSKDEYLWIQQTPYALFSLEVPAAKMKLNRLAEQAISMLPAVYNAEVYKDFMGTWGTHIIVKSLLGGMYEEQAKLKACLTLPQYNPTNTTGNISCVFLNASLECLHFQQRSDVIAKRYIGGDAEVIEKDNWQKTISLNPALLQVDQMITWYDFVEDIVIKENLYKAYNDRFLRVRDEQRAEIYEIVTQRGSIQRTITESNKTIVLDGNVCPPNSAQNTTIEACVIRSSVNYAISATCPNDLQVLYERDMSNGQFRTVIKYPVVFGQPGEYIVLKSAAINIFLAIFYRVNYR